MVDSDPVGSIERAQFARDGYRVVRGLCAPELCAELRAVALEHLQSTWGPVEFEADVGYPGAPQSREEAGGHTVRRLLNACSRHEVFRRWATGADVARHLEMLFGHPNIHLSQCHHNCVMTKHPGYSSATLWHQDIRYWSFDRPELISVWLALGEENPRNGALKVIPGSHALELDRGRLDSALFLRPEIPENRRLIEGGHSVELAEGDVLFFHCRLFHAAGMNLSKATKLTPVFTYHAVDNAPIPDTRSAALPGVRLPALSEK